MQNAKANAKASATESATESATANANGETEEFLAGSPASPDSPAVGSDAPDLAVRTAADVVPEAVRWLWPGNLALGKVSVVAGVPGAGKSLMVAGDFAARVSTGSAWPDGGECPRGDVFIAGGEDKSEDTLMPRLCRHAADLRRVHFPRWPFSLDDLAPLERELHRRPETRLVVVDPVSAFTGGAEGNNGAMRRLLSPLTELAARRDVAMLLLHHLRKAPASCSVHAVLGSVALAAAARSVWLLTKDPDDPERRRLTVAKNNLGQGRHGYAWRLVAERVTWEPGRLEMDADAALTDAGGLDERASRQDLAAAFLSDCLKDGPRSWGAVERAGKQAGHRPRTLERARATLAETFKLPKKKGKWLWRLIGDTRTEPVPDESETIGLLDFDDIGIPGL